MQVDNQYLHVAIEEVDEGCENGLEATSNGAKRQPKRSMRAAIDQMCKECIYDDQFKGGGTWRMQVEACTLTTCPLYLFRPVSRPKKANDEDDCTS